MQGKVIGTEARTETFSTIMQNVNPKIIVAAIIGVMLVGTLATAFYTVPAEAVGVVTRFGKLTATPSQPGLRFKLPFGIDRVDLVRVTRQQKQEFGFGTPGPTTPPPRQNWGGSSNRAEEKNMITGDRNEAIVEWVVQYRIANPTDYLFEVRRPEETLRDVSESVMREVVGDRVVDEVLTIGRQQIESEALRKMQELVDLYRLGLEIDQVQLNNVNPPPKVQDSFNEVNEAQQEKERLVNVAQGEYNREVPRARGKADQDISQAQGYAAQRVNEAQGDAQRFLAVFEQYEKAPEVTKRRLYLETLGKVVPKLGEKIILDDNAGQVLPLLQLSGQNK